MGISIIGNESCNFPTSNAGSHYNLRSDQNSPKETLSPRSSPQLGKVNEMTHQTSAAQVAERRKPRARELPIPTTNIPPCELRLPRRRSGEGAEKDRASLAKSCHCTTLM
ncbi:hypothetical protein HOY80DRAFT_1136250 [Tuber brumale]|nr:hypothetical protein HOY80DRAFT_1136250 [Tuber brumale]